MNVTATEMKRLEARVPSHTKELLERAARLEGRSLTDFVIETTIRRAREVIREHDAIQLTRADQIRLAEALLNPPAPNAKLKKAAKAFLQSNNE